MKFSNLLILASIFCLVFSSCGDDDSSGTGNVDCDSAIAVNTVIADEAEAVSIATNAYLMDQSLANCTALKEAYQAYIDAISNLQDCANDAGVGDDFAESLADAQEGLDDLEC